AAAAFADGVCFIPLAPVAAPAAVIPAFAEALGLTLAGQVEMRLQLFSHLADQQALLVVDNLEHLLAVAGLLAEILARAPGVKLIATSRERLNLQSEYVFVTQGLPTPPPDRLHRAHDYDAIRLFDQAARRAGAELKLQDEELAAAAQVCRTVEGMPLGIELAAAWTPLLSCQEIAAEIQRGLDFLATGLRDLPERQRSLRAVFDHSWRLLDDEERAVLARLSIFQGGFERRAAQEVAGADLPVLLALASKSLIRRAESGRYDLHEVVRQYAFSHLSRTPEHAETCDRHSRFYLALLRDQDAALRGRGQGQARRSLTDESDNLRAAWDWAVQRSLFPALAPALRGFAYLFELSGWLDEGVARLEAVIQAGRVAMDDPAGRRMLGEALGQQALLLFRRGDFSQALACAGESLELLRPFADPNLLTHPLFFQGVILFLDGEFDAAQASLEEALVCARAAGDGWCQAYADFNLGYLAHLRGDHRAGYDRMVAVLTPWRAVGDPRSISLALNHLSPAAVQLGRYQEAEAFLQEGMGLCQEMGDRWGVGTALRYLGLAALAQGDAARAQALLRQSLDVYQGFVAGWDIARTLLYLAEAARALGEMDAARAHCTEALAVAEASNLPSLAEEARAGLRECPQDETHPS
ncbi:MAG: tetratricopeptide repeat protein, partial [Caldilineales bacterium]|nr:tetratricopeptide repeat protein [Caldilineales bacterium]